MHKTQNLIALRNCVHNYANRKQVVHLVKVYVICIHFSVYAVKVLCTSLNMGLYIHGIKLCAEDILNLLKIFLPFRPFLVYALGNFMIRYRVKVS